MILLAAEDLARRFGGVRAVDGVALTVAAGEVVALIGPNGAGKTTCFNLLGGQLAPDRGRVLLDGRPVTGLSPQALCHRGMARTFQVAQVFASLTVRANLQTALVAHARGSGGLWRDAGSLWRDEADRILGRLDLAALADRVTGGLAYGDLKRVELGLALASSPRLLLMDEPTAGMGGGERRRLMALAVALARADDVGILFTEHDMDVVFGHADRVLVMDQGRIVATGTPEAVRRDPVVRRVYLGDEG